MSFLEQNWATSSSPCTRNSGACLCVCVCVLLSVCTSAGVHVCVCAPPLSPVCVLDLLFPCLNARTVYQVWASAVRVGNVPRRVDAAAHPVTQCDEYWQQLQTRGLVLGAVKVARERERESCVCTHADTHADTHRLPFDWLCVLLCGWVCGTWALSDAVFV